MNLIVTHTYTLPPLGIYIEEDVINLEEETGLQEKPVILDINPV
jgi:hypothetical protein